MDRHDIIEVLITVGVVFVSVIGSLIKERMKERKGKRKSKQRSPEEESLQPIRYKSEPDTVIHDMPGDYYGSMARPESTSMMTSPVNSDSNKQDAEAPIGAIDFVAEDNITDTPERRRLIDNLIMGEILARKF